MNRSGRAPTAAMGVPRLPLLCAKSVSWECLTRPDEWRAVVGAMLSVNTFEAVPE